MACAASPVTAAVGAAWLASQTPAWAKFQRSAQNPRRAQAERLAQLLGDVDHAYGRSFGLERVRTVEDLRERLPLVDYDALSPWVDRIADGERGVLTTRPVTMLERTGGSSGPNKLVPYTDALRAEFARAVATWMVDLHRRHPALIGTRSYWSVSPVARAPEVTKSGLRVGFDDDAEYFDPVTRRAIGKLMAVPSTVARLPDIETWRRETWRALLNADDLGLISVWSPTFLLGLVAWLRAHPERLPLRVRRRVDALGLTARALWPRLQVVSCWTEGASVDFLPELRAFLGDVHVQGKGLLATEGVVTVPIEGVGAVPAVDSHLIEFRELRSDRMVCTKDVEPGGRYSPVITTSGGFWRYQLKDVVVCTGRWHQLPVLAFEGRLDRVADLVGEKISEGNARDALIAGGFVGDFALLAPSRPAGRSPHYVAYVDGTADAAKIEASLLTLHHYRYARDLGQLGPVEVVRLRDGRAAWERMCLARGQRLGDLKPTALETRPVALSAG